MITYDLSIQSANKKQELAQNQDSVGTLYHQIYNAVLKYFSCLGINGAGLTQYEDQIRTSIQYSLRTKNLNGMSVNLQFNEKMLESFESEFRNDMLTRLPMQNQDLRKSL